MGENMVCSLDKVNVINGNENFDRIFSKKYENLFSTWIREIP